jgi:hypothetical protein
LERGESALWVGGVSGLWEVVGFVDWGGGGEDAGVGE